MASTIKQKLHQHCLLVAQEQVDTLNAILAELKDALGSESKSTAGDKHETGRAMIQLEQERAGHQLRQAEELLLALQSINILLPPAEVVSLGSLAVTSKGTFYISVGLGKVTMDGQPYFVVSPSAPVAMALFGKRVGDTATFNGQTLVVEVIG